METIHSVFSGCCCSNNNIEVSNIDAAADPQAASPLTKSPAVIGSKGREFDAEEHVPPSFFATDADAKSHGHLIAQDTDLEYPSKPQQMNLKIGRNVDDPVGLDIDVIDDVSALVVEVRAGAIQKWNDQNPESAIKRFDRIIELNGKRGNASAILDILKNEHKWCLTIVRPTQVSASLKIERGSSLGLNLKYAPNGTSLMIVNIDGGPMLQWNAEHRHKGLEIKKYDRIVEVNGIRGTSEELVHAARREPSNEYNSLNLTLLQYGDDNG